MNNPWEIYDLLIDRADKHKTIEELVIGLTWTLCRADGIGLAMSPGIATRTLPWSGKIRGMTLHQAGEWLNSWDSYQATVGMAALNASINCENDLAAMATVLGSGNLSVFEHFAPMIKDKKVVVVGRYPGLEAMDLMCDLTVLELNPGLNDLPAQACEYIIPEADWVFLSATSLVNKSFPRLAELSKNANVVLMGPTVPWLAELTNFGIDYIAGVTIHDEAELQTVVKEGGGVRIFDNAVRYAVLDIAEYEKKWMETAIDDLVTRSEQVRRRLTLPNLPEEKLYELMRQLNRLDVEISQMDIRYTQLCSVPSAARH
jgi:hypothetical protein